jgi:hypothetical protein
MLKKITTGLQLLLCLSLILSPISLFAQNDDIANISPEDFKDEPPLTNRDLDIFVKYISDYKANPVFDEEVMKANVKKLSSDFNVTIVRIAYIVFKTPIILEAVLNPSKDMSDLTTNEPSLIPTESEKELLKARQQEFLILFSSN